MGNAALCAPSIISNGEIKILSSTTGKLVIYTKAPVRAAEIMVESPGQFLCEWSNLRVGQRIVGVTAEEELERGRVYFLLPMEMLYSVLTDEEMKVITQRAYSSRGKLMKQLQAAAATTSSQLRFAKIFPEFKYCLFSINNSNNNKNGSGDIVEDDECGEMSERGRYSRQRSWQPALETIIETPPHHA